jgi:hypothetical protein
MSASVDIDPYEDARSQVALNVSHILEMFECWDAFDESDTPVTAASNLLSLANEVFACRPAAPDVDNVDGPLADGGDTLSDAQVADLLELAAPATPAAISAVLAVAAGRLRVGGDDPG